MFNLSIVIVNWNTLLLLEECLKSIYDNLHNLSVEVIVVDNGSTDGSVKMVQESFPQVQLIINSENVGFARANNQAFPKCKSELIMLLNSDTKVLDLALRDLVDYMYKNPNVGACAPKLIVPNSRLYVLSAGYLPSILTVFNQYFYLSRLFPRIFRGVTLYEGAHDDIPREVEWLSGACMVVRRQVIDQVGPLSEKWFMYAEDLEWCQRMIKSGWKLIHLPDSAVIHYLGSSSDENKKISTMWVSSMIDFYSHDRALWKVKIFGLVLWAGLSLRAAVYLGIGSLPGNLPLRQKGRKFMEYASTAWDTTMSR